MQTDFQQRYNSLNAEQKDAVDSIEGPVMVVAGPGTGKTTILTLRIARILMDTDTPAGAILALTYTDAGVRTMRMKLRALIGARADEVCIHTFHGFAQSIITTYPEYFPHIAGANELGDVSAEEMIRSILSEKKFYTLRPLGNPDLYIKGILYEIGTMKREDISSASLRSFSKQKIKDIEKDDDAYMVGRDKQKKLRPEYIRMIEKCHRNLLLADIYDAYEKEKQNIHAIDFSDLIAELLSALQREELLRSLLQESFLYVLVDEHQDTNNVQNEIVECIIDYFDEPNIFIVGDEKQAIYRFQGASVSNFLRIQKKWPSMKIIQLKQNYRSFNHILNSAFSLIQHNYSEDEKDTFFIPLVGKESVVDKITISHTADIAQSIHGIAHMIRERQEKEPEATHAVLVRNNKDVMRILKSLRGMQISASGEKHVQIFEHAYIDLFLDIVSYIVDQSRIDMLARAISVGLWNIPKNDIVLCTQLVRRGDIDALYKQVPALEQTIHVFDKAEHISEACIEIAKRSGLESRFAGSPEGIEAWRGLLMLAQNIQGKGSLSLYRVVDELLLYRTKAKKQSVKVSLGSATEKVSVLTAHASKGLEFDYVYIPRATESSWLPRKPPRFFTLPCDSDVDESLRDARRLFFVALTRARNHIDIFTEAMSERGEEIPLRFLDEIAPHTKEHIERALVEEVGSLIDVPDTTIHAHIKEFALRSLEDHGLSVTALNNFLSCKNRFMYSSILRIPEPMTASLARGNALHVACSQIWALRPQTREEIQNIIIEKSKKYLEHAPIDKGEREQIVDSIEEESEDVAHSLLGHFLFSGTVHSEMKIGFDYKDDMGEEPLSIFLRGNLDVVFEEGDTLSVFDYKTRKHMSEAEIRGKTKASAKQGGGGYFRQLVFYWMLLLAQKKYSQKAINTTLIFLRPNPKGVCSTQNLIVNDEDVQAVKESIHALISFVRNGVYFTDSCEDEGCNYCVLARSMK